jgi:hypothetical protein
VRNSLSFRPERRGFSGVQLFSEPGREGRNRGSILRTSRTVKIGLYQTDSFAANDLAGIDGILGSNPTLSGIQISINFRD